MASTRIRCAAGFYFLYSATVEERDLTEQFPDSYPAQHHVLG